MKLGVHVSVAGGVFLAVDRAVDFGCNTFQIFVSNPRGWKATEISNADADLFRTKYKDAKMESAVAHGIYLINLASANDDNREQSIESLITGLNNTEKLGLSGLVTHIGSHGGLTQEKGLERVVDAVQRILEGTTGSVPLLLENTAGAGNLVGDKFEEIGEIIQKVDSKRLGFCLDTAHAFESGYPINTQEGLEETIQLIDKTIGLDRLKAIHLNDSMTELNSKRDRHENFGKGYIGLEGMTRIINHPAFKGKPFIMETPELKQGEAGMKVVEYVRSFYRS